MYAAPNVSGDSVYFLFRAAATLGMTLEEFGRLPKSERMGWLCFAEAEFLRATPGAGPMG